MKFAGSVLNSVPVYTELQDPSLQSSRGHLWNCLMAVKEIGQWLVICVKYKVSTMNIVMKLSNTKLV